MSGHLAWSEIWRPRWTSILTAGLVLFGAAVRLRQYVVNRSLWVDEAALALNVVGKSFAALARPLDYWQGAPPGFLWSVKASTLVGDTSELWLRLVPFIAGLVALLVFPFVARRFLSPGATAVATALLALSQPLIYYASELKQYGVDVLVAVLVLGLFAWARERPLAWRTTAVLMVAGAVLVWVSHPAIFLLASGGLALLTAAWLQSDRRRMATLITTGAVWLFSFGLMAWLSFGNLVGNRDLTEFWQVAGYPPALTAAWQWPAWLVAKGLELFSGPLGLSLAGLGLVLGGAGAFSLFRRDRFALALLVWPLALSLLAAVLRLYPFADRLLLFTAPLTAVLVAEGMEALWLSLRPSFRPVAVLAVAVLLFQPVIDGWRSIITPHLVEELRPTLTYVAENWQAGDSLYLYYGSTLPFLYYAPRFDFPQGAVHIGVRSRADWTPYFDEMDSVAAAGGRWWLVFSHVYTEAGASEEALMINYLNRRGTVHSDLFRAPGAGVYLYDFPDGP